MDKLLITGANGFIGSHFLKLMENSDFEIYATDIVVNEKDNSNVKWIKTDLSNKSEVESLIKSIGADYLVHFAWNINSQMKKDESEQSKWFELSMNLVKLFARYGGKRVIIAGTCAEYEWNNKIFKEDVTSMKPESIYGKSKNNFYQKLSFYCQNTNLSYAWGRIFFLYGPRQDKGRIVPHIINSIASGHKVVTENGDKVYDYLHVQDVAQAFKALIINDFIGAVNICSSKPLKLKDLIREIANQMGGNHLIKLVHVEADIHTNDSIVGSNDRLLRISDWKQNIELPEGIQNTIQATISFK